MAATRKLQGEEKVFPACLHLDRIAVRSCRDPRPVGLDGPSDRLARRFSAISLPTRVYETPAGWVATRDPFARFPAYGVSRAASQSTPNGYEADLAWPRHGPADFTFALSCLSPCDRAGASTVDTAAFYFVGITFKSLKF